MLMALFVALLAAFAGFWAFVSLAFAVVAAASLSGAAKAVVENVHSVGRSASANSVTRTAAQ